MTDDRSPPASAREMAEKIVAADRKRRGANEPPTDYYDGRERQLLADNIAATLAPLLAEIEEQRGRASLGHRLYDEQWHLRAAAESALAASREREGRLRKTLKRIDRVLVYPVSTEIRAEGYDFKHDADSVGYAVELLRAALSEEAG